MGKVSLKFSVPSGFTDEHYKGLFRSLLNEISQVGLRQKKAGAIVHFFEERLQKNERKLFLQSLSRSSDNNLSKRNSNSPSVPQDPLKQKIPQNLQPRKILTKSQIDELNEIFKDNLFDENE